MIFYHKDQVWIPGDTTETVHLENTLELTYETLDEWDDSRMDLVPTPFHLLPPSHPKHRKDTRIKPKGFGEKTFTKKVAKKVAKKTSRKTKR